MYLVEKDTRHNYSSRTPSGRANVGLSAYILPNLAIVPQIILLLQQALMCRRARFFAMMALSRYFHKIPKHSGRILQARRAQALRATCIPVSLDAL